MYKIYSPEKEHKYGVLGIKIKINIDNLKSNIQKFEPYNEQEEVDKEIMLKFLSDFDNTLTRQNEYGHFTASAFVLNKERTKTLMIYHNIYNSWTWVGGHSDGDNDLLYVAIKEAKEETGIKNVKPIIGDVGSHLHFNVTYLLEADENEIITIKEDENSGVEWVPIENIISKSSEKWLKENIFTKIIEKMKKDRIVKQ